MGFGDPQPLRTRDVSTLVSQRESLRRRRSVVPTEPPPDAQMPLAEKLSRGEAVARPINKGRCAGAFWILGADATLDGHLEHVDNTHVLRTPYYRVQYCTVQDCIELPYSWPVHIYIMLCCRYLMASLEPPLVNYGSSELDALSFQPPRPRPRDISVLTRNLLLLTSALTHATSA